MEKKLISQELAKKAIELLNETDKLEEQRNWSKAIEKYQQAADYLKQSGFLSHRVADIYNRIAEIKNFLNQEKMYQKQVYQAQVEQIQEQAFSILEGAKKFESDGFFTNAIQQYMSAIKLLVKAGWTESQLENLKTKVMSLTQNIEQQQKVQKLKETSFLQQHPVDLTKKEKIIDATIIFKSDLEEKSLKLKAYEAKRKEEEKIQNKAFEYIDKANLYEKDKNYDEAISNYNKAIELLSSIGWTQQIQNLLPIVDQIKQKKVTIEKSFLEKPEVQVLKEIAKLKITSESSLEEDRKRKALIEFESKKRMEEEIQNKAFNLIDFGKRLEREKKYPEAINQFQEAIKLLKKISWDAYIQPINTFIEQINEKQRREIQANEIKRKRQDDLDRLQKTILEKQKESHVLSSQELELRKRAFETEKTTQKSKEEQFYYILNNADKLIKEDKDYDKAIVEYERALEVLKKLGPEWTSHIPSMEVVIKNVKLKKQTQLEKETQLELKKQEQDQKEILFQAQIEKQLQKEQEKLERKAIKLKEFEEELKIKEEKKEKALKFLDTAKKYLEQKEFDKAIYAYQSAGVLFAEIQWSEELPLIENSIKEIENKKKDLSLIKYNEMQELIEREKREKLFSQQIAEQMRLESEKIKQKEIKLKAQEKEIEIQEQKKEQAFHLLDRAQGYFKKGDFDNAIDTYRKSANIFAEIQWHHEVDIIQNNITEIENKRREVQLQNQKELQEALERENADIIFQRRLSEELYEDLQDMEKKNLLFQEREEEAKYLEERKVKAFTLLDEAQNLLSINNFDEATDVYYMVANIFSEINWLDEIKIIHNAITEIKNKKKEYEIKKQAELQKALEKEAQYNKYIENLKKLRELEQINFLKAREKIEKQKKVEAKTLSNQEMALNLINEADELLKMENFEESIKKYQEGIKILSETGWSSEYLKILENNIKEIHNLKLEKEKEIQKEEEKVQKRQIEEKNFQLKIAELISKEKEKLQARQIEIKRYEELKDKLATRRIQAFNLIDEAGALLNKGKYELSIDKYRQAELILNEIHYPTQIIRDTIIKINEKIKQQDILKQKEFEKQLKTIQEEDLFKTKIAEKLEIEMAKVKAKEIKIKEKANQKEYLEKRKEDSFKIIEEANENMNQNQLYKALELYQAAELILNEIQYPTDLIRDTIYKIREKVKERELYEQKQLELKIKREKENRDFQQKIADAYKEDLKRLKDKKLELEKKETQKMLMEEKRNEAFKVLQEARGLSESMDYDHAIELYRKAELILAQINYPSDSIKEIISKTLNLKQEKEIAREWELKRELEKLEEEKELQLLIEERKRQEEERKKADDLALKKREKSIQEQLQHREAAYNLLQEGAKYLKSQIPDYNKVISLYYQAKKILIEKVGWEPEIKNLNALIEDLQQEKMNYIEKQKQYAQMALKRDQEYELFKDEMRRKRLDHLREVEDQQKRVKKFEERKQLESELQNQGLKLIDEGKKRADLKEFDQAYFLFNKAIDNFKQIGWEEQVHYIKTEISNTKVLEKRYNEDKSQFQKLQEDLKIKSQLEKQRRDQEEQQIRQTIGEVGNLADEVRDIFNIKEKEVRLLEEQQKEQVKREAKEFAKNMGKMIRIREEIITELKKTEEEQKRTRDEAKKARERKELDEIANMLKKVKKE